MNKNTIAVLTVVVIGLIAIGVAKLAKPQLFDEFIKNTSDAASTKGKIRIGMDNWAGYFPLCSPKMKKAMRASEWQLVCEDDQADYRSRFNKLRSGELDFAVGTVDAYLLNAADILFPGVIVMVIDESKGGDAIVAYKDSVETKSRKGENQYNLDGLKEKAGLKIAFTPASPSEHLLKSAATHFDIEAFQRRAKPTYTNFIEAQGSEDALKRFQNREANVAVLWEPDVSRALTDPDVVKLLGTENTSKLIVDILIVRRDFAKKRPEVVDLLLANYFRVLKAYRDNPSQLKSDFIEETDLEEDKVEQVIKGVNWINLTENCERWFGISRMGRYADQGLVDAIDSTVRTLTDYGDFSSNPLPDEDAYKITLKSFVADLYQRGLQGEGFGRSPNRQDQSGPVEVAFSTLTDKQWDHLKPMGTLKREPVRFSSGSDRLNEDDKEQLQLMVDRLKHYPNYRVLIKGHTGMRGDKKANKELSQRRAEAVRQYLLVAYGLHPNRLRAVGLGGSEPLARMDGESSRGYAYRLPRVELYLLTEEF